MFANALILFRIPTIYSKVYPLVVPSRKSL